MAQLGCIKQAFITSQSQQASGSALEALQGRVHSCGRALVPPPVCLPFFLPYQVAIFELFIYSLCLLCHVSRSHSFPVPEYLPSALADLVTEAVV